ncbi:MAG: toll/interleukin-1 receptor domain-containing protein [Deltaproteobacteria bacterium]|nr:MAG: toll/interleukin-1 receptor domain-containing protein [Deltaproteobacteria bacterium]
MKRAATMAQIPGYEYDIFISYTHDDNEGFGSRPGWVDNFEDWLNSWLQKRRGMANLKIWRDKKRMHGNTLFDDAIQNALKSSALFFALTSRNYLHSAYCQKEMSWFHQYHGQRPGGLRMGEAFRVFNILLHNVPHQDWPAELKGAAGFSMNDAGGDKHLGEFTSPDDYTFEKQMRSIVDAVESVIQQPTAASLPHAGAGHPTDRVVVFMADVPDTLQDFKERLISEVHTHNAEIVTDIPPPLDAAGHSDASNRALAKADFSIHLLDQWPGRKILDRKETTYPREQHEIAFAEKMPQLVWVPPGLDIEAIENDQQRQFLRNCQDRPRELAHYELVKCLQTDFINSVIERIAHCRKPATVQSGNLSYLIDTHQKDQRFAFKLADFLSEKGAAIDFNQESQDPGISLTKFEQSVTQVKNLILISGKVGTAWVVGRIKKTFKVISEQFESEERSALENIWVFLAPAIGDRAELPLFPPLIHVNILDNSHSESIDPQITARLLDAGVAR